MECHRGLALTLALMAGAAVLGEGTATAQTLDEIIAKNLAARGGVEKLRSLDTVKMAGTIEARGVQVPVETWAKRPNRIRREQEFPDRTVTVGFDGTTVWMLDSSVGTAQRMTGPQAESTREEAAFDPLLLSYKERGHTVELVGNETLDGIAVHHLRVTKKGGQIEEHYLNAETGLEFRTVTVLEQGGMKVESRTDFSDYRDVEGLKVPFSIRQFRNGNPVVQVKLSEFAFNVPMDDKIFEIPE